MKRHGHTIFEVVQQVVRNFFNEEDEEAKKEFQRLMREPGLLNNASGLEDKEQLVSWHTKPCWASYFLRVSLKRLKSAKLQKNILA